MKTFRNGCYACGDVGLRAPTMESPLRRSTAFDAQQVQERVRSSCDAHLRRCFETSRKIEATRTLYGQVVRPRRERGGQAGGEDDGVEVSSNIEVLPLSRSTDDPSRAYRRFRSAGLSLAMGEPSLHSSYRDP